MTNNAAVSSSTNRDAAKRQPLGLLIVGVDVGDEQFWYWRTDACLPGAEPPEARTWCVPKDDRAIITELLDNTLPGVQEQDIRNSPQQDRHSILTTMLNRVFHGALRHSETELQFSQELANLLLPQDLQTELWNQFKEKGSSPIPVHLLPAQSCSRVPWELLPIHADATHASRFVELADMCTVAPPLRRDLRHPLNTNGGAIGTRSDSRPLLIINPHPAKQSVLSPGDDRPWRDRYPKQASAVKDADPSVSLIVNSPDLDRVWLSAALHVPTSRMLYVGHVGGAGAATAMSLGCPREVYGTERCVGRIRPFSAQDLVQGTTAHESITDDPNRLYDDFGVTDPRDLRIPKLARAQDGRVEEVAGPDLWPMPRYVALIACSSGQDVAHTEPFGLVTAILDAGAELVVATRWTLPTDVCFGVRTNPLSTEPDTVHPLNECALAVDSIQSSAADQVHALCEWQRQKLKNWTSYERLSDSPLIWASLSTYDGRDRRVHKSDTRPLTSPDTNSEN